MEFFLWIAHTKTFFEIYKKNQNTRKVEIYYIQKQKKHYIFLNNLR